MKTHLYLLLLAVGISTASQLSSLTELLTLAEQMSQAVAQDVQNLRVETPNNIEDVNCVSTIFEGAEQLRTNPAMRKFSVFFQTLEGLKPLLTPHQAKEGECDTERKAAEVFLAKLMAFIRQAYIKRARG